MADDMNNAMEAFWATVAQLAVEMAKEHFIEAVSPGGKVYEKLMAGAIAGAHSWYGMYRPRVYKRGYTLSDRSNIIITASEPEATGGGLRANITVENVSPHVGYTPGFLMFNGEYREGGDIMALVPPEVSEPWNVPQDVIVDILERAAGLVFG